MAKTNSKTAAFVWSSIEKFGNQGIQFVIGIVLARILSPRDYGLIGILLVFTSISQILIDSGFSKALIQKNKPSKSDISTVFSFNLGISIVLYLLIYLAAPSVASFYDEPQLILLLRVLSLIIISNALFAIPNTLLSIRLDFKSIAKINTVSIIISGIVAIILAYNNLGVWSLVCQYLLRSILMLIFFTLKNTWSYRLNFSKKSFDELFKFGSNLMVSSLLNVFVGKFSSIFIAKYMSTADLGYYTRGMQFPDVAIGTLGSVLDNVLLPALALDKDEITLKQNFHKVIALLNLITLPLAVLLAVLAEPLILLLLTEKWISIVPIIQIFCVSRFFNNLISVNVNVLYVLNKTNLVLKQHYYKIAVRILLIACALPLGLIYVALAEALTSFLHFIINAFYPGKFISYGIKRQLKQIFPYAIIALILFAGTTSILSYINSLYLQLVVGFTFCVGLYLILLKLFCKNDFLLGMSFVKRFKLQN